MQHNIFIAFDRFARFALCVARNAPRARENCAIAIFVPILLLSRIKQKIFHFPGRIIDPPSGRIHSV